MSMISRGVRREVVMLGGYWGLLHCWGLTSDNFTKQNMDNLRNDSHFDTFFCMYTAIF